MYRKNPPNTGFTLVELLVVITVIAILMGLLLAAFGPVRRSALNFAITTEINELDGAIEQFKTKFGFFPPCELGDLTVAADLTTFKQYLRRIAPNHEETDAQIIEWWNKPNNLVGSVGNHLDNDSILVFWLSGLNRSAQYPLTYGLGIDAMYGTNDDVFTGFAVGDDPAKHIFFEFSSAQLVDGNFDVGFSVTVKRYMQRKVGDQPYLYFDAQRYAIASITIGGTATYPYMDLDHQTIPYAPPPYVAANHEWFNPTTFQIVAAGVDVDFGARGTAPVDQLDWLSPPQYKFHRDNITNFTGGVLEKHIQ